MQRKEVRGHNRLPVCTLRVITVPASQGCDQDYSSQNTSGSHWYSVLLLVIKVNSN